jgi:hypothetical protein
MKPHLRRTHPGHRGRSILRRTVDPPRTAEVGKQCDAPQPVPRPHVLAALRRWFLSSSGGALRG